MSDLDLLIFGCVVTFIGAAGAYVYVREAFTAGSAQPEEAETQTVDAVPRERSASGA